MTQQLTKVHKKLDLTNLSDKQTSAEQGINVIKDLKNQIKFGHSFIRGYINTVKILIKHILR